MSPAFPEHNRTNSLDASQSHDELSPKPINYEPHQLNPVSAELSVVGSTDKKKRPRVVASDKSYRWNRRKYSRNRRRLDIWLFVFL